MPFIDTTIQIEDRDKKLLFYDRGGFDSIEESSVLGTVELDANPINIDYGTVENPRAIGIFNSGTDKQGSILINSDQEIGKGEFCVLSVKSGDKRSKVKVTTQIPLTSPEGKKIFLEGKSGTWAICLKVWDTSVAPNPTQFPLNNAPPTGATNAVNINIPDYLVAAGAEEDLAKVIYDQLILPKGNPGQLWANDGYTLNYKVNYAALGETVFTDDFEIDIFENDLTFLDKTNKYRAPSTVSSTTAYALFQSQTGGNAPRNVTIQSTSLNGAEALVCVFA